MMRPVIGVALWKQELSTALGEHELLHALEDYYVQAVRRAGAIPVLLPATVAEDAPTMLDLIDGLVLPGGGDVSPGAYGMPDDGGSSSVSEAADAFELALIRLAEARDMPLLGICRGCQMLNVAFGGTLTQEITSEGGVHGRSVGSSAEELVAARHEISIVAGSTVAGIYGVGRRTVNTLHHQAIDRVADGFAAVAFAPDGVIESIEATGAWTAIGVQWHPERLPAEDEAPLFRSFVDAVRSRIVEPGGVRFV